MTIKEGRTRGGEADEKEGDGWEDGDGEGGQGGARPDAGVVG